MSHLGLLPDRRLAARADQLLAAMTALRTVSIAALAKNWAEQMAFYRFLANKRVCLTHLAEHLFLWTKTPWWHQRAAQAPHVLLTQDTTEVSFEAHAGRLGEASALGWLSNNRRLGFCLHPSFAIDAQQGTALGFADVQVWARPVDAPDKHARAYRDRPIEEKESLRWITAIRRAAARIGSPAVRLTTIADREADIYSLFARLPSGCDAIIRACRDRRIEEAPGHLYAFLSQRPVAGTETIHLRGDVRRHQPERDARLAYRFGCVTLTRPQRSAKPDTEGVRDPRQLRLWAVLITEIDPPKGHPPICWRLLTTHRVETLAQARQIGQWYRQRWHIEQIFRLLKDDGLGIESSELESGEGLQRLAMLTLGAALDVYRLLLAERGEGADAVPIEAVFDAQQQASLSALCTEFEGRTTKQQNPHPPGTLAWAGWIIARLGGWKGYASQHRAGPATYHRGLARFHAISQGWQLAHQVVYKP